MNSLSIFFIKSLRKLYTKSFGEYKLPPLERVEDVDEISRIIFNKLSKDEPCMIARFGSTEMSAIVNYLGVHAKEHSVLKFIEGKQLEWWWNKNIMNQMQQWSGFFPPKEKNIEKFCEMMLSDMKEVDILGSWLTNEYYVHKYLSQNIEKVWLIFLDPFWAKNPWTKALEGKKVLVIHPFASLIDHQYRTKRKDLFANPDILPDFDLITMEAVQSLGGKSDKYNDWFEALESMKQKMDSIDYDICLLGCGAYGFPLAAHAKRMNKKAIHIGGSLQLLFGIIGNRWENPNYAMAARRVCPNLSYPSLFNSYWIHPYQYRSEITSQVENNCYW